GAEVVYPEMDMALRLGKKLLSQSFFDYISLDDSVEIRQLPVSSRMVGRSIEELGIRRKYGLNIIAIENNSCTNLEVMPDYQFREGDVMVAIGKIDHLDGFES